MTIRFRLDARTGLPPYRQLVEQVRQALRLGTLVPGDQLPTVRAVVREVAINPNTVHRAYRELEQQGLVEGRQGQGTFVRRTLGGPSPEAQAAAGIADGPLGTGSPASRSGRRGNAGTARGIAPGRRDGGQAGGAVMVALEAKALGRRYGRKWGLRDCTVAVPEGKVAGLVGPNGAGKSTLLRLAAGLSRPSAGEIRVLGQMVRPNSSQGLARVGYLDQERPLYRHFRVDELLTYGRRTNRAWDAAAARGWLNDVGVSLRARVHTLSVGQQAQVALALCFGKRPELLLLDEPVASLDPLARRHFMGALMETVAARGTTVVVSSHILSELESICDHLVILSRSRVPLSGDVVEVLADHRMIVGPPAQMASVDATVVMASHAGRQSTLLVRGPLPPLQPGWQVLEPTLDEIVLAYLEMGQ